MWLSLAKSPIFSATFLLLFKIKSLISNSGFSKSTFEFSGILLSASYAAGG